MKNDMKKKYIMPEVEITSCYLEHSFLAGSDRTKSQGSELGNLPGNPTKPDESQNEIPTVGNEEDVTLGSKQYNAWASWDE